MAQNEQVVEVVRFTSSGLDEIDAQTKSFADELKAAEERAGAMARALGSPAFARHAQRMSELARVTDRNALALRNQQRAADLSSGAFQRQAAAMGALNKESARLGRMETMAGLVAQHGRFGAVVRNNAAELTLLGRVMGGTLGAGVALGVGLARSGLQGTVEGYRLEYAWLRLSRAVAGIAVPAVEKLAEWVGKAAGWFERLSGRQQDTILKIGLFTAGTLAAVAALKSMIVVGGAAMSVLRGIGLASMVGGGAGAVGGAAAATGNAGAALASRGLMTGAAMNAGAGLAGGAAASGSRGLLARAAPALAPVAVGAAAVAMSEDRLNKNEGPGAYYNRLREGGRSRLGAGFSVFGKSLEMLGTKTGLLDESTVEGEKKKRRDISPLQVAQDEAGGAHMRIQEELLKVSAAQMEKQKEAQEVQKQELELRKQLNEAMKAELDAVKKKVDEGAGVFEAQFAGWQEKIKAMGRGG